MKEFRNEVKFFKLTTHTNLNDILTDLKSFKQETRNNFKEVNEKLDDSSDIVMSYDKRIEKLEEKVFVKNLLFINKVGLNLVIE